MADTPFPDSLQASILALLITNKAHGAIVAGQVEPRHFDDAYQDVATRVLQYWKEYNAPPGQEHVDDLFAVELSGKGSARLRRLLADLLSLSVGLNAEYVANRAQEFIEGQSIKSFLLDASERFQQGGDSVTSDIRDMMSNVLRNKPTTMSAGLFLGEARNLEFLERTPAIPLGIDPLDNSNIGPRPSELLLYIASKGSGKTWFCVHVGKQGLIHRERVLHISLEYAEEKLLGRYMQSLFVGGWDSSYIRTILDIDEDTGRLLGWKRRTRKARINFAERGAKTLVKDRLKSWGMRLNRIVLKSFPSGQLTMGHLEAYLDYLELKHKFIPTMLIVDYPDLMKLDPRNIRIDLGRTFVNLRGLGVERNMAVVTPTQGTRASMDAKQVRSSMVSEDISKVNTADLVVTYSRTKAERRHNLARLYVPHSRDTRDELTVLISQAYDVGQYATYAALMDSEYWARLKEKTGDSSREDEDEGGNED